MKKALPWWVLVLAFVVLPVLELYLLIQVGQTIGVGWTLLLLFGSAILGSYLVKREGSRAWRALTETIQAGRLPHRELADAALVLIGGTLLVTPGFVTDFFGFFAILPFTRPIARRLLGALFARKLLAATTRPKTQQRPGPDSVVQGEVVD